MLSRPRLANPSGIIQAPDNKALKHPTQLIVASEALALPAQAQQYFEPGVNVKLTHRRKPKVNFELPSDMPTYPLGVVPVNQTPGAAGEEPPLIVVKEALPGDLLSMFAKISEQQAAESRAVEAAKREGRSDVGTVVSQQYQAAMTERQTEARAEKMMRAGFSPEMTAQALQESKMARAVEMAREAVPSAQMMSVEAALEEKFPRQEKPDGDMIRQMKAAEAREKFLEGGRREAEKLRVESEKKEGGELMKRARERTKALMKGDIQGASLLF
jgi:hypothetical protein